MVIEADHSFNEGKYGFKYVYYIWFEKRKVRQNDLQNIWYFYLSFSLMKIHDILGTIYDNLRETYLIYRPLRHSLHLYAITLFDIYEDISAQFNAPLIRWLIL